MDETCGDAEGKAGGGGGVEDDMEVGECSEEEEDEEEDIDLGSSPITDPSSVIMSMTSPAAPTAYEGLASPLRVVSGVIGTGGGKPVVGIKRGPGRPRGPGSRGGGAGGVRVKKSANQPPKLKRWKGLLVSGVYSGSNGKTSAENGEDESTSPSHPSTPVEQKTPIFVDEPRFTEQWAGKVCVLCNLTEYSQLGQGKMIRIECSTDDLPKEIPKELILMSPPETPPIDATSPRHQAQLFQNRRQKGMSKFRNAHGGGQEPVDELSLVGHNEAPEASSVVDAGYIYFHEWCAAWCTGIIRKGNNSFQNVPASVMAAMSRRCYHCSRFGAGSACIIPSCNKHFHTPCAAAAATFQYTKTMILICSQHIDHVETNSSLSDVVCHSCNSLGNVGNLVMCSMCGKHHHGACIGNSLQPGLRAGWQCPDCRMCQLCRQSEETSRMLVCDSCDKAYHPFCVRPAMSSVPKVGWKCKRCRLCSDCGARTPGGGLSSRWHSNYTVCDSCYQQRNKGFSCPVCHKAYRAAALREMVRCFQCQRFVHGTCDKEADFVSYHRKKDAHPEYEYICLSCKNNSTAHYLKRKDSTEDFQLDSSLSVSQESLMANDDADGDSEKSDDTSSRFSFGLGKGKPFYASKIAKKRLGLSVGPGRPKGSGKLPGISSTVGGFHKRQRFADFGRKRGAKTKIRGMFGVPGLALQSPTWSNSDSSSKNDDEPGCENKIVLCSSKEKFVLSQDVCVMCGAMGIDQEACLICCSQCGQCYHPYCVTVKVTKVMLTRGWRCLDCTVCEGCGQRNDEGRLILCDDCDISYHIYCMDPPMGSVPTGGWKCKWCAQCLTCGATTPGVNATWQSNFSQCGACASRTTCPACLELYTDGDLIIKCINCDRWLHCLCDTISTEQEAEAHCAQGYTCMLCRPNNVPLAPPVTPTRIPSPEFPSDGKATDYYVDGVCLSEIGLQQIKTLSIENSTPPVRRKRPGYKRSQESDPLNLDDGENEAPNNTVYKDGMVWGSKENGPVPSPPEGFSLFTSESGVVILKRKKQRNLQKLGIGGFSAVKMRSSRFKDEDEGGTNPFGEEKPRRKPRCNKKRSKLAESYPSYLQEAFFGRELLDITKESTQEFESSSDESDLEKPKVDEDKTISLSQDELKVIADANAKKEEMNSRSSPCVSVKEEDISDTENFKDILHLPDNILHNDLVNTIMNERDGIKSEIDGGQHDANGNQKDELSEILGPNFSLESMVRVTGLPNMDSKDVEEIFKGVLTNESQEPHNVNPLIRGPTPGTPSQAQVSPQQGISPSVLSRSGSVTPAVHPNLPSPIGFPSPSPYNSEYSNSPQFSPDGSPWGGDENANNQRNSLKMEQDEALGQHATIAAVLYANINNPEFKREFPNWNDRFKHIIKKWRQLPNEKRAPYVQLAKENRTNSRLKKSQQIGEEKTEDDGSNGKRTPSGGQSFEVCPPPKIPHGVDRGGQTPPSPVNSSPTSSPPDQKLVSTASNTSPMHPPTPAQETFPTTIPSHPSTIQYIPLNTSGIRATFHIIPTSIVTTTETSPSSHQQQTTRTIQYQYERSTIHYPPTNVVIQSVPPLIMTSTPVQQQPNLPNHHQEPKSNILQLIPTKTSPVNTVISQPSARSQQVQFIQTVKTVQSATEPPELKMTNTICSPVSDQHIRVLTPSEIMRTLPSLGQETYDTPPPVTEQDKTQLNKTTRETEQEKWKQMQALRQQHQLFVQNRNAVPRLPRTLSSDGTNIVQYSPETPTNQAPPTQQLLVSTPQEPASNVALGGLTSPRGPQFASLGALKAAVRQPQPTGAVFAPRGVLRPPTPANSPFSPPPRQPPPEEMNRQLRDLLKGQHVKQEPGLADNSVLTTASAAGKLRAQLAQVRAQQTLHPQQNVQSVVDARIRYQLLQQTRPGFPGSPVRLVAPRQPLEQFNVMVQRQQFAAAAANAPGSAIVRAPQQQIVVNDPNANRMQQPPLDTRIAAARDGEEIPDSVTAELEKLEQEGSSMGEVEAEILSDLVEEDDDGLLAEMGADFNILAYADPELDDITDGDKTNLHIPHLDDLEEEMEKKKQSNSGDNKSTDSPQTQGEGKPPTKDEVESNAAASPQISLPNRTPPTSLPVSVVAGSNLQPSSPANQQTAIGVTQVLPSMKDNKPFTPFVAPTTPLPRMQLMPGAITPPRPQAPNTPLAPSGQNSNFIQLSPPPPYPGPPPPYPGPIQGNIRVGGPKVARSALPPMSAATSRRTLLLQEQPLLLEDLLEEEKREQEQRSGTPVQGPSSGTSLMSDADFEMLRADVLGTTNAQVSSPPQVTSVPILNIPIQPAPPPPPENIVTEQDRQMQMQYEQWLHSNNAAVTQQLKYYESEVLKLRKLRKSLNSRQRQLKKNGHQLSPKDAVELQRIQGETTVLQKHLEAARKQSKTHSIVMQEYQSKQEQKSGMVNSVITANVMAHQGVDTISPQSPNGLMSAGLQQPQQSMLPSPQTAASPLHHSPRIGTPHSQCGDDKSDNGLSSPRPPPMAPTPPSPHQFHQIRHPGMVPRFARSPEGQPRPRLILQTAQNAGNLYSAQRAFIASPQSPNMPPQGVVAGRLTPQHQQLLMRRHQLQEQKRELQRQQEALQQEGLLPRQLSDGVQRQVLLQRQSIIQDDTLSQQEQQQAQQQLQVLQQRQQPLQNRQQQLIMTQQGKVGQYRHLIQQQGPPMMQNPMQSPTNLNQQFAASSPVPPSPMQSPSPISTPMSNTPQYSTASSPLHPPPSPMMFQNPGSSPMPQQSPRVQNYQTANSPMAPQSPMVYTGLQTPTSPMPQFNQPNSPMPPHSPRVQQYGQPPSSPMGGNSQGMMQQQYVHRPNSPMVSMGSPMPMRRPSSTGGSIGSSPAADRPQSVEPRTPQEQDGNNMMGGGGGGGGGGYNPIPFPPDFFLHGYVKLGLKGGSPMWSDKAPRKQPLLKGKVGQPSPGTSANNMDEKSRKSLVCADYNEFDEESTPPTTPPIKPVSLKKPVCGPMKSRPLEDTDSELTVYDDIVLVDGCKEGNLEVEELQSALQNNVMSTVVSMPMMIDDPDILDDCLVSSSDLVVLGVNNTANDNDCILEVVGKDDDNILLLDDDIRLKVDDELMELDDDIPSSPVGRKRLTGKVLPGQSIHQEDDKSLPDSPDDSSASTIKDCSEPASTSSDDKTKTEDNMSDESPKESVSLDRHLVPTTTVQPNVVVPQSSANFTPVSTQKSIPVCSERNFSKQQAVVASLVQNAVNAAKLVAAESQQSQKITTPSDTSNAVTSHTFSRPLNIIHGNRAPQNQYLSSAVITNKIENQLASGGDPRKDGMTLKSEPSTPELSPSKNDVRIQENSMASPNSERNRLADYLKGDLTSDSIESRDPNKNFKRASLILKLDDSNESKLSLCNSIRTFDRSGVQNNSQMIFNIIGDKSDGTADKNELKLTERSQLNATENYNSNRPDQVTLPAVSSSILEAQLTSMLRSTASDPPSSSNQKIIYAIVNHNNKEPVASLRENPSPHEDIKVEGLAAHLQRTIKSESEGRLVDNDIRNSKIHQNFKTAIYPSSKGKTDFVVGGYKVYTGVSGENIVIPEESRNHFVNKIDNTNNHPQVIVKQEPGLSSTMNKPKIDRFPSGEILQQRVVSSSEISQLLNEKETHHGSFCGAKIAQKDEPKKFLSLSNMLLQKREGDDLATKTNLRLSTRTADDSQNVLLKQLLQNTTCATSTSTSSTSSPQSQTLPNVPSLEAQLARPVPPTPSSLIPPLLSEPPKQMQVVAASKDMSVPASPQTPKPPSIPHTPTTPESIRVPSAASSTLDELLSPPPQPPTPVMMSGPQINVSQGIGPPIIKREPMSSGPCSSSVSVSQNVSAMTSPIDIKKENLPVTVPVAVEVKKEVVSSDEMLSPGLRMEIDVPGDPQDLKKLKRRQYQQKRRQSLGKESVGGTPKKRPRKSSKVEEDYDSFIDSLMLQLRQLPTAMTICEPNLTYNFTGSPVLGSGDLTKVNSSTRLGELKGTYGNAHLPHENDYYNTIPFGDVPPKAPSAPSTQRGFYNEEFAPLKLHATKDEFDDRKYDYNRDTNDTPDTIVSSSSPECVMPEFPSQYPGLQFIDSDSEDEKSKPSRFSPEIPIISPLVVRPKPIRFYSDMDKENEGPQSEKNCDNVTVTLTLNSQAADDILSVLRNLANVLRIPVPVHYSITERMSRPSHRLGLCKIRNKDGKDAGQVDIQSILNGGTKFCRHCDVVITNKLMRKKASELPLVAKQGEDELYFCSTACYMQLALAHPAPAHQEKAASLEHRNDLPSKKLKTQCDLPNNKLDSKCEKPVPNEVAPFMATRGAGKRENRLSIDKSLAPPPKKSPSRYRVWTSQTIPPPTSRHKKPTEKEITEMLFKCGIPVAPPKLPEDTRTCLFCHQMGDGVTHGPARLLNYDVNKWVHLNCALWSDEVYETTSGGLVNVEQALQNGSSVNCAYCNTNGATLKCYKIRCSVVYHLPCAVKDQCVFYKNKTLYCASHVPKNEKENELTTLSVMRRVYIQRDEPRQIASIMHNTEQNNLLRVGSLTFLSVGQLLPHQLQNFHTPNYIYPIGYKILRMYWSMRVANRRCKYICSIHELENKPEFRIVVQEKGEPDLELKDTTARGVWLKVLEPMAELRRNDQIVKLFTKYITGEDLFGLTEPVVVRVLESLPGVDTLTDYKFKYGKNPFLELPLAINPTGCARSEVRPKGAGVMRKAHTQRTSSASYRPSQSPSISIPGEPLCPYSKQFVHSKSSQYKKMKQEWRNNVYLARSKIQGLGLYAARDLEKHTMVIEYIGEIIRTEVAETREKQYEAKNRGIYMFRLDEDRVVDATLSGGLARYINHSCYPNCVAETVEVDRDIRIIIFTKRRISRGEELAYDYKFDIEDDQHKIPCMCGAPNCRKWMN